MTNPASVGFWGASLRLLGRIGGTTLECGDSRQSDKKGDFRPFFELRLCFLPEAEAITDGLQTLFRQGLQIDRWQRHSAAIKRPVQLSSPVRPCAQGARQISKAGATSPDGGARSNRHPGQSA